MGGLETFAIAHGALFAVLIIVRVLRSLFG